MNLEQFKPSEPEQEGVLPLAEHNAIQKALIEEFGKTHGAKQNQRNELAMSWIGQFAGPFRELSGTEKGVRLIEEYRNAGDEQEKESALNNLQDALEELNQLN